METQKNNKCWSENWHNCMYQLTQSLVISSLWYQKVSMPRSLEISRGVGEDTWSKIIIFKGKWKQKMVNSEGVEGFNTCMKILIWNNTIKSATKPKHMVWGCLSSLRVHTLFRPEIQGLSRILFPGPYFKNSRKHVQSKDIRGAIVAECTCTWE